MGGVRDSNENVSSGIGCEVSPDNKGQWGMVWLFATYLVSIALVASYHSTRDAISHADRKGGH